MKVVLPTSYIVKQLQVIINSMTTKDEVYMSIFYSMDDGALKGM